MREFRTYGSMRGAPSNGRPYRDPRPLCDIQYLEGNARKLPFRAPRQVGGRREGCQNILPFRRERFFASPFDNGGKVVCGSGAPPPSCNGAGQPTYSIVNHQLGCYLDGTLQDAPDR